VVDCGFEISLQPVLERGSRVRVIEGPLMGMVAQVEDKNRRGELIVTMDVLQQGVRVSLPDSFVELLGEDEL
jgi:transcription antitermination factor NusG